MHAVYAKTRRHGARTSETQVHAMYAETRRHGALTFEAQVFAMIRHRLSYRMCDAAARRSDVEGPLLPGERAARETEILLEVHASGRLLGTMYGTVGHNVWHYWAQCMARRALYLDRCGRERRAQCMCMAQCMWTVGHSVWHDWAQCWGLLGTMLENHDMCN